MPLLAVPDEPASGVRVSEPAHDHLTKAFDLSELVALDVRIRHAELRHAAPR